MTRIIVWYEHRRVDHVVDLPQCYDTVNFIMYNHVIEESVQKVDTDVGCLLVQVTLTLLRMLLIL